jgi:hypothetical protein
MRRPLETVRMVNGDVPVESYFEQRSRYRNVVGFAVTRF